MPPLARRVREAVLKAPERVSFHSNKLLEPEAALVVPGTHTGVDFCVDFKRFSGVRSACPRDGRAEWCAVALHGGNFSALCFSSGPDRRGFPGVLLLNPGGAAHGHASRTGHAEEASGIETSSETVSGSSSQVLSAPETPRL